MIRPSTNMILNNKYQVSIVKIPPDGNCLFSSIVHQLTKLDYSHEAHKDAVRILRQESVEYISANKKLYWNHILMEATAARGIEWPNTEELQRTLINDHLRLLSKDREWGGSEILNAVRDQYGFTIRVFSREQEPLIFEGRGTEKVDIYYNGIDHYDSIQEVTVLNEDMDERNGVANSIDMALDKLGNSLMHLQESTPTETAANRKQRLPDAEGSGKDTAFVDGENMENGDYFSLPTEEDQVIHASNLW